ncbi:MAG: Ribosomal RNA small subunit methyltransferase D [Firmicutes bacterium ADurb.Bin300]|jgi:16S rRNA (guanine966-N2)-methyltransferase|nr:MAG: Ribosomal RNA small subunit methyltransferase D [Firmicutes bacterium ADurb.Bin300]HOD02981.1 16S rRNA (guanine(966)-N(2))-methyltransferase RsmD [Clostridiales bacterium]
MRVITGTARGKRLKTLQGTDVRPTSDKTKEALFSIIQFDLEGTHVLDLFSGSGQLGIEAISRGAVHCVFVDLDKDSVKIIKENLKYTGFGAKSSIINTDALSYLSMCDNKFDIVFLDPPYNSSLAVSALKLIDRVLNKGAIVVCETSNDVVLPETVGGNAVKRYKYGKTILSVYR